MYVVFSQILSLHHVGIYGGCCRITRKLVDVVMTTMITGSPFGKGDDPELNVSTLCAVSCTGAYFIAFALF